MRTFITLLIVAAALLQSSIVNAQDPSTPRADPPAKIADEPVGKETFQFVDRRLTTIEQKLDSIKADSFGWQNHREIITLFLGVFAALSGFGVAYFTQRAQRDAAKEDRLESHLFDSLKWFEEGTQKRSIGLSIIEGNWDSVKTLHATWTALLVNQAVYLVAQKDVAKMTAHEMGNRRRICSLLKRATLTMEQQGELTEAIQTGKKTNRLTGDDLEDWDTVIVT